LHAGQLILTPLQMFTGLFFDPVQRGVYGPFKPVIREHGESSFERHHVCAGPRSPGMQRLRCSAGASVPLSSLIARRPQISLRQLTRAQRKGAL